MSRNWKKMRASTALAAAANVIPVKPDKRALLVGNCLAPTCHRNEGQPSTLCGPSRGPIRLSESGSSTVEASLRRRWCLGAAILPMHKN